MREIDCSDLNALILAPCQLKVPMERLLADRARTISAETGELLRWRLVSNAVLQENVFEEISQLKTVGELPDIMIAPGIGHFFYEMFTRRFRNADTFAVRGTMSPDFEALGLGDPKELYSMIGFNPLVFLVDSTREPDLPVPESWQELLDEKYAKKVAYRGRDDRSFCEGVLLTVYGLAGEAGVEALGRTVKCRLHPAEMAKMAGSGRPEAPFVSVIPLGFARMARKSEKVRIVWPREGAAVNPLMMLVKKQASSAVRAFADELVGTEMNRMFARAGFFPLQGSVADVSEHSSYTWCGWDFIERHDMHALLLRLNGIMHRMVHEGEMVAPEENAGVMPCCS